MLNNVHSFFATCVVSFLFFDAISFGEFYKSCTGCDLQWLLQVKNLVTQCNRTVNSCSDPSNGRSRAPSRDCDGEIVQIFLVFWHLDSFVLSARTHITTRNDTSNYFDFMRTKSSSFRCSSLSIVMTLSFIGDFLTSKTKLI